MPDLARFGLTALVAAAMLLSLPLVAGFFGTLHPAFDSARAFPRPSGGAALRVFACRFWQARCRWHGLLAMLLGIGCDRHRLGVPPGLGVGAGFLSAAGIRRPPSTGCCR